MTTPNVFVSIGTPQSAAQKSFKVALLNAIRAQGFVPRSLGEDEIDSDHAYERPFDTSLEIIRKCQGVVVVGYEKDFAPELRRMRMDGTCETEKDVKLTSPWNHAEAAVAYAWKLPLLILREQGVRMEGMFEQGVAGHIVFIEPVQEQVGNLGFQNRLEAWAKSVRGFAAKPRGIPSNLDSISLNELWSLIVRMKVSTLAAIVSFALALMWIAYRLGAIVPGGHR